MKKILIQSIKRYKWLFLITFISITANMYVLTIPSKIIGEIVDLLYNIEVNKDLIIKNTIYLLITSGVLLITRIPWRYLVVYISRSIERDIKDRVFEHFLKLKLTSIQNIKNGELMSYLVKDVGEIRQAIYRIISHASRIVILGVIATYIMITRVNLKLTIVTLLPIIVTIFIIVKLKNYVEKSFRKSQNYFTELSEYVQESTEAIRTTKAYSEEGNQLKEFIRKNKRLRASNNTLDVHSTLISTCINICFGLCYGISLLYGSKLVIEGQITTGDFVAFNSYIGLYIGPVEWLPSVISRFKRAQIAYHRLDDVFKLEKEKISTRELTKNELLEDNDSFKISGDIDIKNLTFRYKDNIDIVLKNIDISIKKGETLGIIGKIGSGKTTLVNLLLRLYPVENGKIFIDGKDINDISLQNLRNSICYITQDNFLFSTTIKENIQLFKDGYDDNDIVESTEKSMIRDDIQRMENGIYTEIGEKGVDLSGGQKQRVVISRAFLNNSNIIIFDDTFSALDNKTEEKLLENIKELVEGKTCIIISNRISDIKHADKIIVLDSGEIVESGDHQSLINNHGEYYKFYKQQSTRQEAEMM